MEDKIDRYAYHQPDYDQLQRMERLRSGYRELHRLVSDMTQPGRERSLAFTYLEESATRANKAIAFEGKELL